MKNKSSDRDKRLKGLAAYCESNNLSTLRVVKEGEWANRAQRRAITKLCKRSSMKQGEPA